MAEPIKPGEEGRLRRNAGLDPIGHVLRQTYDAENHDSLGNDLTGLMLHLARVEDAPAPPPPARTPPPPAPAPRWWERLFGWAGPR